ncbi:hypothetical protein [Halobellus inordinatus]|uniref:hypothetical protein n=1 Tax=Halobellus inordinatus TaxID=1126236 RepID=UPI00210A06D2|nr:hypothetical protein [Halobellus inordinatus]
MHFDFDAAAGVLGRSVVLEWIFEGDARIHLRVREERSRLLGGLDVDPVQRDESLAAVDNRLENEPLLGDCPPVGVVFRMETDLLN